MAYDEALAARVRDVLLTRTQHAEKHMFGGICFMVGGHMCCGVAKNNLMLRVGKERHAEALARPHARPMDFTGKPLAGMVYVEPAGVRKKRDLERWLGVALDFVDGLPPKLAISGSRAGEAKGVAPKRKPRQPSKASAKRSGGPAFAGFGKPTLAFLRGLSRNNSKDWFTAHRDDYEAHYVAAGAAFVSALGPQLRKISRTINYDPRVNGSIFRINRDVRFSTDKTPYKAHLDLWFWEGDSRGWDTPGFFFRLEPRTMTLGAGMHRFDKTKLATFREAVVDARRGKALAHAIEQLKTRGAYEIGGRTRKKVPRGFDPDHPRADLLLHDGFTASLTTKHPDELGAAALVDWCVAHYKNHAPLHRWLLREF